MTVSVQEFERQIFKIQGIRVAFRSIEDMPRRYTDKKLDDLDSFRALKHSIEKFTKTPFVVVGGSGYNAASLTMRLADIRKTYQPLKPRTKVVVDLGDTQAPTQEEFTRQEQQLIKDSAESAASLTRGMIKALKQMKPQIDAMVESMQKRRSTTAASPPAKKGTKKK